MAKKAKGTIKKNATARRLLDQRLKALEPAIRLKRPASGWIRTIRDILGMTAAQLAKRVGVTSTTILQTEMREKEGAVTLATLERMAAGLGCEVRYVLVPQNVQGFEGILDGQIRRVAETMLERVSTSMALEDQKVSASESAKHLDALVSELKATMARAIWGGNPVKFVYPVGATPIDSDEAEGLIPDWIATQAELNAVEQENILEAMGWLQSKQHHHVLSEEFVRSLHRRMFGDVWRWAGKFRKSEKNIGVTPMQIAVSLHMLLDDVAFWHAHQTYGVEEQAIRLHHGIVRIHCFPNGNGRHARLLADAFLASVEHAPIQWGSSEGVSDTEHRAQYIASLRRADGGDFEGLLGLFMPSPPDSE